MPNESKPAPPLPVGGGVARARVRLLLAGILLVAILARTAGLGRVPPPLFRDEAEKGYNAWSLWRTGRDYEGRRLPLFINVFGTHTSAAYQYATAPFVGLFGLAPWTTRLAAALAGIATVALLFFCARALFDPTTALVATALLAFSPWHLVFSRWALQGIFLPLLFTIAAWGTIRFRQGRRWGLPIAAGAIALAAWAYVAGRLLAPLFLLVLIGVAWRDLRRHWRWAVGSAAVLALLVAPTAWFVFGQPEAAMARFRRITIARPGASPAEVAGQFLVNYARHFDPVYLAVRGDRTLRHSPMQAGEIYPIEYLFFVLGLYFLIRRRDASAAIVVGWILIAPTAASLTSPAEVPHALRSLAGVPAFALAIAFGMVESVRRLRGRSRTVVLATVIAAEVIFATFFLFNYFILYPRQSVTAWQNGLLEAILYARREAGPDGRIFLSGMVDFPVGMPEYISQNEIFVAYFEPIEPAQFQRTRLEGTRYRIVPPGMDFRLLTGAGDAPIFLVAFVAEVRGRDPAAVFPGEPYPIGVYRF